MERKRLAGVILFLGVVVVVVCAMISGCIFLPREGTGYKPGEILVVFNQI